MSKNEENNRLNDKEENKNPFSLPGDYFGSFSQKMMRKIELADEIREFKLLSAIDKKNCFVTPENYFEESASLAALKTELASYETLRSVKKQNTFTVPAFYFEKSAGVIKAKIEVYEELRAYPALSALEKANGFEVPQGYFDEVAGRIGSEHNNGFGRVLRLVFSRQTAYAIAAMLVFSFGLYFFNQDKTVIVTNDDCHTLACLDKKEVMSGNQLMNMDDENLMEIVNADALVKKLSEEEKAADKKQEQDYVMENADVNDIVDGI